MTPMDLTTNYKNLPAGTEATYYRCTYGKKSGDPDWYQKEFGLDHSGVSRRRMKIGRGRYSSEKIQIVNCPSLYWKESEIDEWLVSWLKNLHHDAEIVKEIKQKLGVEIKEKTNAFELQKKNFEAQLNKKIKLKKALIQKLALEEFTDIAEDLRDELITVKSEIAELENRIKSLKEINSADIDELTEALTLCQDLYERFPKLKQADQRRLAIAAFKEIKLKKGWVSKEDFSDKGWIGVTLTEVFEELNEKWLAKVEDEMKRDSKGGNGSGSGGKKSSINKMTITH